MGKWKVCVYAICKNEAKFVRRWMDSMREADWVVVLDTGSDDDTPQMLRELGAQVTEEVISPWRFDVARNRSLELVPEEADICVCTDLDEVFRPGWRAALEAARSELEMLRAEVERFRAGEQARMAADEEARRRAEVERRFKAAAGNREFLHEYVRKGLLADFAAALEDAANAGKSDAEVFSALTREKNCFAAQNPPPPLPAPEAAELERASGGEAFRALPLYEQFLFAQREPERARRYLAE